MAVETRDMVAGQEAKAGLISGDLFADARFGSALAIALGVCSPP
jgi:hypothetical protein